jgi:hypothetical protein
LTLPLIDVIIRENPAAEADVSYDPKALKAIPETESEKMPNYIEK